METRSVWLRVLPFVLACSSAAAGQANKLKVYVSVDMEGVAGVASNHQLSPTEFEYGRFREFMTREALAAVSAAKEAGASEILVSDAHGNGENLLIELFPSDVRIVRSFPRRLSMVAGIDGSFDALILIGYHASSRNPRGIRGHTFSNRWTRLALNGSTMTEGAFNAAIAGHFGVPVVMVSGDDAAIEELRSVVGPIEAAETKKALAFHSADTLTPEAGRLLIEAKVKSALGRLKDFKPYQVKTPVNLEVNFKHYRPAELLSYLRNIERIDSHTIRFQGNDMLEIADFVAFLTAYNITLEP